MYFVQLFLKIFQFSRYASRSGLTGLQDTPPVIVSAAGRYITLHYSTVQYSTVQYIEVHYRAGLPSTETSLARLVSRAGYRTAAVGKVLFAN